MHAITVGKTATGESYRLSRKTRSTHLHVCGASGRGKSRLLEAMIRDDIRARRGVCVIDPHGTLYKSLVKWIAMRNLHRDRAIHLIDPSIGTWTTGINPLRVDKGESISRRADAVRDSFVQVWGGEDTSRTPLLKKCLRAVIHVLIVHKLTLLEAMELITTSDKNQVRQYLTGELEDYVQQRLWADFNALEKRLFSEQFASTVNRFVEFLDSPEVRTIIGTNIEPLDLRSCMRNGEVVLVNLQQGVISFDNARLIGTLITSDLFSYAIQRSEREAQDKPFYLYLDECSRFTTESVVRSLDETRKYGLHCILSHQRLGQLRREDEFLYNAIMAGAQTKVIFGCEEDDDAEILSRHLFRSEFDLERPVANMMKPVAVGQVPVWLQAESTSGSSVSGGGTSNVTNVGTTTGERFDADGNPAGGTFVSSSEGGAKAQTTFDADVDSQSFGRHETLKTEYKELPTQNWTLERWIHEGIVRLRELPERRAVVKAPGQRSVEITTPFIPDPFTSDATAAKAVDKILTESPYAIRRKIADQELKDRQAYLQTAVDRWKRQAPEPEGATYDDDLF